MAPNRITRGGAARRALVLLATTALAALALGACGGSGGDGGETGSVASEKAADAETLNNVLARELAAVRAYERVLPLLHGPVLASARVFRAQEQEHADAVVKALRGLGEKAAPAEEEIESEGLESQADALAFLYEVESVSIADDLRAVVHLDSSRSLLGSIAANQAQHLVLLRRALGAGPAESIPSAFEDGGVPAPSEKMAE